MHRKKIHPGCLGLVSVMSRSCLGLVSVFFGDVSVLFWCCLGLVSAMSRCCFGDVSVMSRCCFGDVSVIPRSGLGRVSVLSLPFLGDVSVLLWWCLGDVLVMSRSCLGLVSVFFGWCLRVVVVLSGSCLGLVLSPWCLGVVLVMSLWCRLVSVLARWCLGVVLVMFLWCLSHVSVVSGLCLGLVSVFFWWCLVVVLVLFCWFLGGVLGIFQWCVGRWRRLGHIRWSLRDVWWWCCDVYDDEWVMAWCFVVDVAVLFFCFGDCVLIFWWWTLMNILTGFSSKTSNSNLNLYIMHLWANQSSCSPYVDRWCFLVSVMSRSCLGPFLVLSLSCLGVVLAMSLWCLGHVSVSVFFWWCLGVVLVCLFGFLMVFWGPFSDVLVASRAYSVKSPWCVVMVLWCFDDEWLMAWCFVVDVAVLFFCFGDGVLIFWWWWKTSNSNFCRLCTFARSCGPYVDGWCFKTEKFMLSDMSRPCLGLVSVMCQSWFCVAWVMSRGVTVMSRSCFRNALLMSRGCRDDVSVTPRVLFRWCHVDVSVLFL